MKTNVKINIMQNTNILLFVRSLSLTYIAVWFDFRQVIIDTAVDQWRKRLQACVRANGGHLEHLLWTNSYKQFAFFACFWFKWRLSIVSAFYCVDVWWCL